MKKINLLIIIMLSLVLAAASVSAQGLVYSTFLGGTDFDAAYAIDVDDDGNAYIAGKTRSTDFPTTVGALNETYNGGFDDIFVIKIDGTTGSLIYSTFLGGTGADVDDPLGSEFFVHIVVDDFGNAIIGSQSESTDYPTTAGAYDTTHNGDTDAVITKLNADGDGLIFSTFFGGLDFEWLQGVDVDSSGNVYFGGLTVSPDFPTTASGFSTSLGGANDAFVTKLNPTGSSLVYSTYLGGTISGFFTFETANDLVVDDLGNAYVTGSTPSSDFPVTTGAYDTTFNSGTTPQDAFLTVIDTSQSGAASLAYSTFIGGATDTEWALGVDVDSSGVAFITGFTESTDFPTTGGAFNTIFNGGLRDCFVSVLNPAGTGAADLLYSTYLGSSGPVTFAEDEGCSDIIVDENGNVYVSGTAGGADWPITADAFDTTYNGKNDATITKFNSDGTLNHSTFLGGSEVDAALGIAVHDEAIYITGFTNSSDFNTTTGAFDESYNGAGEFDGFVSKYATEIELGPQCQLPTNLISWWDGDALKEIRHVGNVNQPVTADLVTATESNDAVLYYDTSINIGSGEIGRSFVFDGNKDHLGTSTGITAESLEITGPISLSLKVKSTDPSLLPFDGGFAVLADKSSDFYSTATNIVYGMGVRENVPSAGFARIIFKISDGSATNAVFFDTPIGVGGVFDGNWHHLVGTWDGTTDTGALKLYVDGTSVSANPTLSAIQSKSGVPLKIGADSSTKYRFNGEIDEVMVYDKALNQDEIDFLSDLNAVCPDADGDFVNNTDDNCAYTPNLDQQDLDGDGVGTVCDGDELQQTMGEVPFFGETVFGTITNGYTLGVFTESADPELPKGAGIFIPGSFGVDETPPVLIFVPFDFGVAGWDPGTSVLGKNAAGVQWKDVLTEQGYSFDPVCGPIGLTGMGCAAAFDATDTTTIIDAADTLAQDLEWVYEFGIEELNWSVCDGYAWDTTGTCIAITGPITDDSGIVFVHNPSGKVVRMSLPMATADGGKIEMNPIQAADYQSAATTLVTDASQDDPGILKAIDETAVHSLPRSADAYGSTGLLEVIDERTTTGRFRVVAIVPSTMLTGLSDRTTEIAVSNLFTLADKDMINVRRTVDTTPRFVMVGNYTLGSILPIVGTVAEIGGDLDLGESGDPTIISPDITFTYSRDSAVDTGSSAVTDEALGILAVGSDLTIDGLTADTTTNPVVASLVGVHSDIVASDVTFDGALTGMVLLNSRADLTDVVVNAVPDSLASDVIGDIRGALTVINVEDNTELLWLNLSLVTPELWEVPNGFSILDQTLKAVYAGFGTTIVPSVTLEPSITATNLVLNADELSGLFLATDSDAVFDNLSVTARQGVTVLGIDQVPANPAPVITFNNPLVTAQQGWLMAGKADITVNDGTSTGSTTRDGSFTQYGIAMSGKGFIERELGLNHEPTYADEWNKLDVTLAEHTITNCGTHPTASTYSDWAQKAVTIWDKAAGDPEKGTGTFTVQNLVSDEVCDQIAAYGDPEIVEIGDNPEIVYFGANGCGPGEVDLFDASTFGTKVVAKIDGAGTINYFINEDTKLCRRDYELNDFAVDGVIIINSSDITFDCNLAKLIGNRTRITTTADETTAIGSGPGIGNPGQNIEIKNCEIVDWTNGMELGGNVDGYAIHNNNIHDLFGNYSLNPNADPTCIRLDANTGGTIQNAEIYENTCENIINVGTAEDESEFTDGIVLGDNGDYTNNIIRDNTLTGFSSEYGSVAGIFLVTDDGTFSGNQFLRNEITFFEGADNTMAFGMFSEPGATPPQQIDTTTLISNNTILDIHTLTPGEGEFTTNGILLFGVGGVTVTGNEICRVDGFAIARQDAETIPADYPELTAANDLACEDFGLGQLGVLWFSEFRTVCNGQPVEGVQVTVDHQCGAIIPNPVFQATSDVNGLAESEEGLFVEYFIAPDGTQLLCTEHNITAVGGVGYGTVFEQFYYNRSRLEGRTPFETYGEIVLECEGVCPDNDGDGVCNDDDLCAGTVLPESVPTQPPLRPNHYAEIDADGIFEWNAGSKNSPIIQDSSVTLVDTYGCSCEQILDCKPGKNKGEYKFGCTGGPNGLGQAGTMGKWLNLKGWAKDNNGDGFPDCSYQFEEKDPLENCDSDQDGIIDALDDDNDGDGIPDEEDSEDDSADDPVNKHGKGSPKWWCKKHPGECEK